MAKKMKKIMLGAGAGFLVLILAILYIVAFHLGTIVKHGMEKFMPSVTGTPVKVGNVTCLPFSGHIDVKDLEIGNPEGYKSAYAFKIRELTVTVNPMSVLSDKIFISKVLVDGMSVSYEQGISGSNLTDIKKNIEKLTKKEPEAKKPAEKPAEKPAPTEKAEPKKEKRFQIKEFDFQNSTVAVSTPLTGGQGASLPLPAMHLKDLGMKDDKGLTGTEMTPIIFAEIITGTVSAVKNSSLNISGDILNNLEGSGKEILNKSENIIKGVKDLF